MNDSITLKDIVAATGAKIRQVQFWADHGALLAESDTNRQGRGTHRKYHENELMCAKLANEMHKYKMPIGEISKATHVLRLHPSANFIVIEPNKVSAYDDKPQIGDIVSAVIIKVQR